MREVVARIEAVAERDAAVAALRSGATGAQPAVSLSVGSAADGLRTDAPHIRVRDLDHLASCAIFSGGNACSCGAVVHAVKENPGGSA